MDPVKSCPNFTQLYSHEEGSNKLVFWQGASSANPSRGTNKTVSCPYSVKAVGSNSCAQFSPLAQHLRCQAEQPLQNLQTHFIMQYQLHSPVPVIMELGTSLYCISSHWIIPSYLTYISIKQNKKEVLGRTNRLLSLIQHGPHWKRCVQQFFYCCVWIRYRDNVSTEPLCSNDRGIYSEPLPINDKETFTEPYQLSVRPKVPDQFWWETGQRA
jgi:hypothetical protein